jgi:hypothetical protein
MAVRKQADSIFRLLNDVHAWKSNDYQSMKAFSKLSQGYNPNKHTYPKLVIKPANLTQLSILGF